jgi:hypothetical protein
MVDITAAAELAGLYIYLSQFPSIVTQLHKQWEPLLPPEANFKSWPLMLRALKPDAQFGNLAYDISQCMSPPLVRFATFCRVWYLLMTRLNTHHPRGRSRCTECSVMVSAGIEKLGYILGDARKVFKKKL